PFPHALPCPPHPSSWPCLAPECLSPSHPSHFGRRIAIQAGVQRSNEGESPRCLTLSLLKSVAHVDLQGRLENSYTVVRNHIAPSLSRYRSAAAPHLS